MLSQKDIQKIEDALMQGRKLKIIIEFVDIDDEIGVGVDFDLEEDGAWLGGYLGANSFGDAIQLINEKL